MARVLVVDDDPWTQRMVSAVLVHAGHEVQVASDAREALKSIASAAPDLVITEVRLPTMDGWSFAGALRAQRELAQLPFIFLAAYGSNRAPGPGFDATLDVCLAKPFRLEALEEQVKRALSRRGGAAPVPRAVPPRPRSERHRRTPTPRAETQRRPALTGALEAFGLSSVLIVLELERKSGVVVLHGDKATGRIYLREGRVIRAAVDGKKGAFAVYELLGWTHGRFEFSAAEVDGDDEIGSSTSFLLMEGARLQDERKHDKN